MCCVSGPYDRVYTGSTESASSRHSESRKSSASSPPRVWRINGTAASAMAPAETHRSIMTAACALAVWDSKLSVTYWKIEMVTQITPRRTATYTMKCIHVLVEGGPLDLAFAQMFRMMALTGIGSVHGNCRTART